MSDLYWLARRLVEREYDAAMEDAKRRVREAVNDATDDVLSSFAPDLRQER